MHLVVHYGIHKHCHTVLGQNLLKVYVKIIKEVFSWNLLWRHIIGLGPEVDLLVLIDAGDDEEDPGPPGLPCEHPAQPEHHRPLVLLHHLAGEKTMRCD